jgi:hypothetical protein
MCLVVDVTFTLPYASHDDLLVLQDANKTVAAATTINFFITVFFIYYYTNCLPTLCTESMSML